MCSESHYCTLVEYIICHAAFTGCHLAERLQCSWKPLSASNDIIKIGACAVAPLRLLRSEPSCTAHPCHGSSGMGLQLYGPSFGTDQVQWLRCGAAAAARDLPLGNVLGLEPLRCSSCVALGAWRCGQTWEHLCDGDGERERQGPAGVGSVGKGLLSLCTITLAQAGCDAEVAEVPSQQGGIRPACGGKAQEMKLGKGLGLGMGSLQRWPHAGDVLTSVLVPPAKHRLVTHQEPANVSI